MCCQFSLYEGWCKYMFPLEFYFWLEPYGVSNHQVVMITFSWCEFFFTVLRFTVCKMFLKYRSKNVFCLFYLWNWTQVKFAYKKDFTFIYICTENNPCKVPCKIYFNYAQLNLLRHYVWKVLPCFSWVNHTPVFFCVQ